MNTKKIILGFSALALTAIVGTIVAGSAYAYQGDYTKKGPNYSQERHEAMEKAFEKNDYNAWKNLMQGKGRVTQVVTKDNFAKFAQAHKLGLEGKTNEANKIRTELGLGLRNGSGQRQGMGLCR
ncbi:hypothetical protein A2334_04470 [Candidatus Roizmanbacteria bacterium RIFOXYB2_FULL_38_10]|uniref:Uncharacterized protein n=1 Tax=Candidatus Roizmanbacteria bacterium RIFOXYD1_FULL_38_12 TaxID=1802093 RepID=A0A1F7KZK0_9BACT|nr:MAG: hypothetical protein A3K47_00575 [Candidatus Roizmanbacteria bacterium RIFOXYA2_FULL_38_14]OGK63285.1 MAG: hypothetical protein A3K27_00575 [Candidatus Roizmanbacteria bacterium RIFOXYA1_FULL_37_12]OGK65131.1 MAG: hypothetical protein A3K38_00575 [Candidatus Roizmanbacteria bacterium RIFOXYB1_FULL_40_23]OGK68686.1 MAG: hypothetical protein A2334_04470 [Candidatus Roizmanbacteria bacterium RIFOXYB2_FULL_38_10]OGK69535.1 MAG: hypothetical protein A3K21_00575 [Candidatus Roizmanbacteria ba